MKASVTKEVLVCPEMIVTTAILTSFFHIYEVCSISTNNL